MVSQTSCLQFIILLDCSHDLTLRQVSLFRYKLCSWNYKLTGHLFSFFNVEKTQIRKERALDIHYTQPGGITGHVMLLCMVLMYTTAHHKIRNQCFEAFWYTHHLALIFFLALYTHATGCFVRDTVEPFSPFAGKQFWAHCIGYQSWRYTLAPGILYFFERVYRVVRSRQETEITKVVRHPYGKYLSMQKCLHFYITYS